MQYLRHRQLIIHDLVKFIHDFYVGILNDRINIGWNIFDMNTVSYSSPLMIKRMSVMTLNYIFTLKFIELYT